MPAPSHPISNQEVAGLFRDLERPLAIAVSGGVDSIVMLHLVALWRTAGGNVGCRPPLVITIDHGLRPAAAQEASFVAGCAQNLGFDHETLHWTGGKPGTGVQDAARRARYDLLLHRLARDNAPRDLLLGHTLEDQAETLLMRLARGSGVDGLSAMRPLEHRIVVVTGDPMREVAVRLHRPLLGISKSRLIATARAQGLAWHEDASNSDRRFERVRLRTAQSALSELGLSVKSLARSAARLGLERVAQQAHVRALATDHVCDHNGAFGELVLPSEHRLPHADVGRLLARLLAVYGGAAPAAQLSQIETLTQRVLTQSSAACGRLTLGGCLIDVGQRADGRRHVHIFRETTRKLLPQCQIAPGAGIFWDQRFYISVASAAPAAIMVGPFTGTLGLAAALDLPQACLASLPAVLSGPEPRLIFGSDGPEYRCIWPNQHAAAVRWHDHMDAAEQTI